MINCGLILEGGGMRGLYTAGVLDYFIENNYYFKDCLAVSAGACHACSYLSGQEGRAFRINVDYLNDKRYGGFANWIKTGDFFNMDMHLNIIPNELDLYDYDAFNNRGTNFYAVATNCVTGQAEYLKINDIRKDINAVWASSSLPLMSHEMKYKGSIYLDGGISDPLPIKKSIMMGNKKNVVILTRQSGYVKEADKLLPILRMRYGKKYPHIVSAMETRHIRYNQTLKFIEKAEKEGSVFVIRPSSAPNIGRIEKNRKKLEKLYGLGYSDAENRGKELKKFIMSV